MAAKKFRTHGVSMLANSYASRLGVKKGSLSKRGSTGRKTIAKLIRADIWHGSARRKAAAKQQNG